MLPEKVFPRKLGSSWPEQIRACGPHPEEPVHEVPKPLQEQVVFALRQVETGTPAGGVAWQWGATGATIHLWTKG